MKKVKHSFFQSFGYALKGIGFLFKEERNARIHLLATIVVIIAGIYYKISIGEWGLLVLVIGMVIITEAINTAIENTIDFISTDRNPKLGKIKDIAAGAVLIAAIIAILIACFIFIPKIF